MKTGDMVKLNIKSDKNDQNPNLFIITKIDFRKKTVNLKRSGVESANNPVKMVAFERIARHIKVDVQGKIDMIRQLRKSTCDYGAVNALKNLPEPKYILTDEDIDDILVVQQIMTNTIPRVVTAAQEINETFTSDTTNLEQSSTFQAVPTATLDLTKLSEDSSWVQSAQSVTKNRQNLDNSVVTSNGKPNSAVLKEENGIKTFRIEVANDYYLLDEKDCEDDYEEITADSLAEATQALEQLNQSTQSIGSFNNSALLDISTQIQDQARYESDMSLLNSTVMKEEESDQVLPDIDVRPIRNRKPVDRYTPKWS